MINNDNIVALASAPGSGAISVIRLSGSGAIQIGDVIFKAHKNKKLQEVASHTVHLGYIKRGEDIVDEALVTVFKGTNSYTGEPVVEFSCHGSSYIQQEVIRLCIENGARMARAGEFTLRAFLNGKMDLSRAEAVADLISSENEASHKLAMQQMRGGFANEIHKLREELLNFASLIELELDFSQEDVEFADRGKFRELIFRIQKLLSRLIDSFSVGNVIKNGIHVAIVGEPNVGKSTLLNALLNEERAIVSAVAGTTRDSIEDEISIGGIGFRFIDTAGIRETEDQIEFLGIKKTFEKMKKAQIVLFLLNCEELIKDCDRVVYQIEDIKKQLEGKPVVLVGNKVDTLSENEREFLKSKFKDLHFISAQKKEGVEDIEKLLLGYVNTGVLVNDDSIVTNARHYQALVEAQKAINEVQKGINEGVSSDLVAIDIREALYHFGEITGEITTDDLLENIFSKFCIGK